MRLDWLIPMTSYRLCREMEVSMGNKRDICIPKVENDIVLICLLIRIMKQSSSKLRFGKNVVKSVDKTVTFKTNELDIASFSILLQAQL
jgi:hypothetical protein